jgi:hypothetical protein
MWKPVHFHTSTHMTDHSAMLGSLSQPGGLWMPTSASAWSARPNSGL